MVDDAALALVVRDSSIVAIAITRFSWPPKPSIALGCIAALGTHLRASSALPATLNAAVFIVANLPRERPSLLPKIFAARCAVPVREAEDKVRVEPGTVYFAPPDYHLLLDKGQQLALSIES